MNFLLQVAAVLMRLFALTWLAVGTTARGLGAVQLVDMPRFPGAALGL